MIDLSTYRGRTVAVMGLGKSGLVSARALLRGGATVLAWDDGAESRDAAAAEGIPVVDLVAAPFEPVDALVLSPGIPHTFPTPNPVAVRARDAGCRIIGDIELLARAQPAAHFIGITGTNGKSTTTALIGHILSQAGRTVEIGGNLGMPALDLAPLDADGSYVIEMSSYQLELTDPVPFEIAVLLNISADHLDRHGGMDGYIAAKRRIFDGQEAGHTAIIGIDDDHCRRIHDDLAARRRQRVVAISSRTRAAGGVYAVDRFLYDDLDGENQPLLFLDDVPTLPGTHNAQNACAAYAAARAAGLAPNVICDAIRTYPGLAHRQELVAEIDGIRYVNDSKATNADAAARALSCYDNIYWIAGGLPKEDGLAAVMPLLSRVRHAYLIGDAAAVFDKTLRNEIATTVCGDLTKAVDAAHNQAQRDRRQDAVVLLSPACASFDQYPNFEARGLAFTRAVAALPGSARDIRSDGAAA
ncbi:MAG: UDP-N-acetylmuramoyl-L-alanine--D-glutamate ligase [Alphaproteobacteria bacterium]|nr:UDP-N-acetylmuramoyl-L-alanine--D-glutamate ligase [Alphaproteobacteria bacterium]